MENTGEMTAKSAEQTAWQKIKAVLKKIDKVIDIILTVLFHMRKLFLAAPVVYFALKIAKYNMEHLPQYVGLDMQANGAFAQTISRDLAVMGPLGVTAACLFLMLLSRKAMYPWAISIFSLALPIVLLLSNQYPA